MWLLALSLDEVHKTGRRRTIESSSGVHLTGMMPVEGWVISMHGVSQITVDTVKGRFYSIYRS